jgi:hypothetical protein
MYFLKCFLKVNYLSEKIFLGSKIAYFRENSKLYNVKFPRPQAMLNKGSLFYIHCAQIFI